MAFTTWNPADRTNGSGAASPVLSGGNLTATMPVGGGGVRAVDAKSTGIYMVSFQVVASAGQINLGVMPTTGAITNPWYVVPGISCIVSNNPGNIYTNSAQVGSSGIGAVSAGDVVDMVCDVTHGLLYFRRNGAAWVGSISGANPTTGTGGAPWAGFSAPVKPFVWGDVNSSAASYTANFGASSFTYAVPSGVTAGWPANALPGAATNFFFGRDL